MVCRACCASDAASDASMACCCRSAAASSAALARARRSISTSGTVARAGEMPLLPLMYSATSTCRAWGCRGRSLNCTALQPALRGVAACGAPCWSLRCTACLVSQSGLNVVTRRWQDAAHLLVEAQPPCAPLCRRRRWWRRIWHCCVGTPSYAPGTVLAKRLLGPLPRQAHVPRRSPPPGCLERRHGAIAVQKLLRRAVLAGRLRSVLCLDDGRHGTASPNDCSRARRSRLGCRGRSECWRVSRRVSRWQQQSAAARSLGTRRCGRLAYGSGLRTPRPRE